MTCVSFKQHVVTDAEVALTLEDVIRILATYGGTERLSFDRTVAEFPDADGNSDMNEFDGTTPETSTGTWSVDTNRLKGVGGGSGWYWRWYDDDLPLNFVLSFLASGDRGAVLLRASGSGDGYTCGWDSSHVWVGKADGTYLCRVPSTYSGTNEMTIAVQEVKYQHLDDTPEYLFISVWVNGHNVLAAVDDISAGRPDTHLAFGVYGSDTVYYSEIVVPELTAIIPWASLDVGEPPMGGITRAIGMRNVVMWSRFDGTLRAIKPKARDADWSTDDDRVTKMASRTDRRAIVTQLRLVGAWDEIDVFASDADLATWGKRFFYYHNPELLSKVEISAEGADLMIRLTEAAHTADATLPALYTLEPEDRITIGTDDWVIESIQYDLSTTQPTQRLTLRKYGR